MNDEPPGRGRRVLISIVLVVAGLLAGFAWAISSPVASSPDDDFHLGSIWCAWGQSASGCEVKGVNPDLDNRYGVVIPPLSRDSPVCFYTQPDQSAACQSDPAQENAGWLSANRGLYPGGFYALMRLAVTPDATVSVLLIRMFSFALCALMLVGATFLLKKREQPRAVLAVVVVAGPLGWFFFASTNPTGVATVAVVSALVAAVALFRASTSVHAVVAGLACAGYVLVAGATRADGAYFAAVAIVVAAVSCFQQYSLKLKGFYVGLGAIALAGLISRFVFASGSPADAEGVTEGAGFFAAINQVSSVYFDGSQVLGWLDTPMPGWATFARLMTIGLLLAAAFYIARWRRWVAVAAAGFFMIVVPLYAFLVGAPAQPRYFLSLLLIFSVLLCLRLPGSGVRFSRQQALVVAVIATVANGFGLYANLRRYVTGTDVGGGNLSANAEWWWGWAPGGPNLALLVGFLAFGVLAFGLAYKSGNLKKPAAGENQVTALPEKSKL